MTVHYTGWTTDGKMFDSSVARGEPATFPRDRRHRGLDRRRAADGRRREAPPLDSRGARLRRGRAAGRPQGMLVFDVELLDIAAVRRRRPCRPTWRAPADAKKTASRASPTRCCRRARARAIRARPSSVTVHYSGWTTDGKMFDSSVTRGEPATFALERRHRGLDRRRAADGRGREDALLDSGASSPTATNPRARRAVGPLVFDIELAIDSSEARRPRRAQHALAGRSLRPQRGPTESVSPSRATMPCVVPPFSFSHTLALDADPIEGFVVALGLVVEERDGRGFGSAGELEHVADERMAPAALLRHVGLDVLRVVDEEPDLARELRRARSSEVTGARAGRARCR